MNCVGIDDSDSLHSITVRVSNGVAARRQHSGDQLAGRLHTILSDRSQCHDGRRIEHGGAIGWVHADQ